jgi:riboflavin kinase / FMN adenylyltransferase
MTVIYRNLADLPEQARGCVVAVGAFDGMHLGHQSVLAQAQSAKPEAGLMVLTFEPPPKLYFSPNSPPNRLTTPRLRALACRKLGVTAIVELPFDAAMAGMSANAFGDLLVSPILAPAHLAVGHDFAFGKGRAGNPSLLQAIAASQSIGVTVVQPVLDQTGERISSTRIRSALQAGDIATANALLGRAWTIEAEVVHGEKRGRTIGFPTANMTLGAQVAPRFGIYVVSATLPDGNAVRGVANFGRTPTTGLRDHSGDLYGQRLDVHFHAFLRPEEKYETLEALVAQIELDAANARAWFAQHG